MKAIQIKAPIRGKEHQLRIEFAGLHVAIVSMLSTEGTPYSSVYVNTGHPIIDTGGTLLFEGFMELLQMIAVGRIAYIAPGDFRFIDPDDLFKENSNIRIYRTNNYWDAVSDGA